MSRVLLISALILGLAQEAFAQGSQLPPADVPLPASAPVVAEPVPYKPPRFHWYYRTGVAARLNPLGLFLSGTFQARLRLYDHDSRVLKDNYIGLGPIAFITPALARAGIGLELQPLSILQLSASYEFIGFFGTFDYMQSFPSASSAHSDTDLGALTDLKTNYVTYGGILTLAAMLQAKVGPIAVRSNWRLFNYQMTLRAGDTVWYDIILDVMSPGRGWVLTSDTDVLFVTKFGLAAGLRYSFTHAFYQASDFAAGETPDYAVNSPIHRLGPFFAYTFYDDDSRKVNAPTLVLLAQWFMRHRYRTGADVSAGFPWIALAFQFKGIL